MARHWQQQYQRRRRQQLLGVAALLLLGAPRPPALSTVRVRPSASGATDAVTALNNFSLDGGGAGYDRNGSYALADNSRFSRATWDCGAWGTQGAVITEKILSLGGPKHLALARRWLLNTPVLGDTGEAFSTEGGQFHAGADGKWEANAELILSAALFAKHAGQHEIFQAPVSRLVCAVHANGSRTLLTRGGDSSLRSTLCGDAVGSLEAHQPLSFATTMNAAYQAGTEGLTVNASGSALFQDLQAAEGFVGLSLPLRQYKPLNFPCWTLRALVYKASLLIHTQLVDVSTAAWVDLAVAGDAGRYRVELWPAENATTREDGIFTSAAWVSTVGAAGSASPPGGSMTFQPGGSPGDEATPVPATLGARLAMAMKWQLRFARASEDESVGIMTIPDKNWRGVGRDDVGASSAMWDLIRSGYKDTWLNVRFVESIKAMLELQHGGLMNEVSYFAIINQAPECLGSVLTDRF